MLVIHKQQASDSLAPPARSELASRPHANSGRLGGNRDEAMAAPITVTIADDDPIVRAGLDALLDLAEGIHVIDQCSSLGELRDSLSYRPPSVVITDIRMPPTWTDEGIRAANEIRGTHPETGVVVLSRFVDPSLALAVLGDGSHGRGYLLKERVADGDHLSRAIRTVAAGASFVDTEVLDALTSARRGEGTELSRLSPRELDVLHAIAQGLTNAAAADTPYIGERAVEKHISSIFAKLELSPGSHEHRRVKAVLTYLGGVQVPKS